MDAFDTSSVKSKKDLLDVITAGPDEDLEHLLFHTVDTQIKVSSVTTNQTNQRPKEADRRSTRLQSDSTEFGEF